MTPHGPNVTGGSVVKMPDDANRSATAETGASLVIRIVPTNAIPGNNWLTKIASCWPDARTLCKGAPTGLPDELISCNVTVAGVRLGFAYATPVSKPAV